MKYILSFLLLFSFSAAQKFTINDVLFLCQKSINKTVIIDTNETFNTLNIEINQNTNYCGFLKAYLKHKKFKLSENNHMMIFYKEIKFPDTFKNFNSFYNGNTPLSNFGYTNNDDTFRTPPHTWQDDKNVYFELGRNKRKDTNTSISKDDKKLCSSFSVYYPKSTKNEDYLVLLSALGLEFKKLEDSLLICDDNKTIYNNFLTLSSQIEQLQKTAKIKITIFTSSKTFSRDLGLKLSGSSDFKLTHLVGTGLKASGGYSILPSLYASELDNNITIKSSTDYYLTNNILTTFENATTIPYVDENYIVTNQTTNQSTKYKYKSVGFKIALTPKITNEQILLNLDLSLENVVNVTNNLPTTAGKQYKSIIPLVKNKEVLLAGISDLTDSNSKDSLPSWFDFFGRNSKLKKDETINILISWID